MWRNRRYYVFEVFLNIMNDKKRDFFKKAGKESKKNTKSFHIQFVGLFL